MDLCPPLGLHRSLSKHSRRLHGSVAPNAGTLSEEPRHRFLRLLYLELEGPREQAEGEIVHRKQILKFSLFFFFFLKE